MPALNTTATRFASAALFAIALGAAYVRTPAPPAPGFVTGVNAAIAPLAAMKSAGNLPPAGAQASAPSLTQLPDGRIAVAWLGSDAAGENSAVWLSLLSASGWSEPQPIANRENTGGATFMHVNAVARPIIQANGETLHFWHEAVLPGGGRFIAYARSTDDGSTWSKPVRLAASPLGPVGTRLSAAPLPLADGGFALPASGSGGHGEWLRLTAEGRLVDLQRLQAGKQPVAAARDSQHAVIASQPSTSGFLLTGRTADGGRSWTEMPDGPQIAAAPLALLSLPEGRLLLAGNPAAGRNVLRLWLSADGGSSWQACRDIDNAPDGGASFADPGLLRGSDGRLHLVYSWRQQHIRHVTFSEAWLTEDCR